MTAKYRTVCERDGKKSIVSLLRLIVVVFGQRNYHSSKCMVSQRVHLSMNQGMRLHSCIAQIEFERKHGMSLCYYDYVLTSCFKQFSFSLYCTCFKLLHNEMSSVSIFELRRDKVSVSFIISFKTMSFQHSNSHTHKFNVLIPISLHCIMMQTQVTMISTKHTFDPMSNLELVVEPPCISEDSFFHCFPFYFQLLG